jgi:hypothetical protein
MVFKYFGNRRDEFVRRVRAAGFFALSLALLSGCSATSLRCGVDGESSFVELYGAPQHMSQNTRQFGELCGFAYQGESSNGETT